MTWYQWVGVIVAAFGVISIFIGVRRYLRDPLFYCRNCEDWVSVSDGRVKSEIKRDHRKVCFVD